MLRSILAIAAAVLLAGTFVARMPMPARAAPLDPDSCARLKTEQEDLEKREVRANMAKGPDWAKANLAPEKLSEIKRMIDLDEQLLFRCPGRHLVNLPLEPDPPPPPPVDEKKADGEQKADAPKAPAPEKKSAGDKAEKKQPPQKKAAPPPKSNADAASDPDAPKPSPKTKAAQKPKPKSSKDDAYKPPASDPNNPFGLN